SMKVLGFKTSTVSGLSIAITALRIPSTKQQLIDETQQKVNRVEKNYDAGAITERERHNQLIALWAHCREQITKSLVATLKTDRHDEQGREDDIDSTDGVHYLNPVYQMSNSGARANIRQVQ